MLTEVAIPKNNEKDFIGVAERLGIKSLLFLYEKNDKSQSKMLEELQKTTKIKLQTALLNKKVPKQICFCTGERKNVEDKNATHLYGFELLEEKEHFHYRKSGMNQVISKLLQQKNKTLVIDMEKILEAKNAKQDQPQLIGRLSQNLILARKHKLNLIICSLATKPENLRTEKHYKSFLNMLGFEEQAKIATELLSEQLK